MDFASTLLRPNAVLPHCAWTWDSPIPGVRLCSPQEFCFGEVGVFLTVSFFYSSVG